MHLTKIAKTIFGIQTNGSDSWLCRYLIFPRWI